MSLIFIIFAIFIGMFGEGMQGTISFWGAIFAAAFWDISDSLTEIKKHLKQ